MVAVTREGAAEWQVRSVLLVDDDPRCLRALASGLERRQLRVLMATDATAAWQLASDDRPDLAIVELRLGSTSGIELIRALKTERPELSTVLISGYLSVPATVSAMRAGADVVLSKPVTSDEVLSHVEHGVAPDLAVRETPSLARVEWEYIARVVTDCHGNISLAARQLGILRQSLQRRLRKQPPRC